MSTDQLKALCAAMRQQEDKKDKLEAELKIVNAELDRLRLKEIPELMEALEVKTTTFEGLGRVQLAADLYASTKEGKKEAAMQWLRDCGYGDMISETYNASTLKALFRRQLKDGIAPPDDIFNITPFIRASIVKA